MPANIRVSRQGQLLSLIAACILGLLPVLIPESGTVSAQSNAAKPTLADVLKASAPSDWRPLDPARRYAVAMPGFLLTGGEVNLGFLTRANPQVSEVTDLRDVRLAVIDALAK